MTLQNRLDMIDAFLCAFYDLEPADISAEIKRLGDQMHALQRRREVLRDLLEMHRKVTNEELDEMLEPQQASTDEKEADELDTGGTGFAPLRKSLRGLRPALNSNPPLYPSKTGTWTISINGRNWSFGPWREPKRALDLYHAEKDYIAAHNMRPLDSPLHINNRRRAPKSGTLTLRNQESLDEAS